MHRVHSLASLRAQVRPGRTRTLCAGPCRGRAPRPCRRPAARLAWPCCGPAWSCRGPVSRYNVVPQASSWSQYTAVHCDTNSPTATSPDYYVTIRFPLYRDLVLQPLHAPAMIHPSVLRYKFLNHSSRLSHDTKFVS